MRESPFLKDRDSASIFVTERDSLNEGELLSQRKRQSLSRSLSLSDREKDSPSEKERDRERERESERETLSLV